MPSRTIRVGREEPLLDFRSLARPGPASRIRLSPAQPEQIARTVSRAPEVLVKVSGGARTTAGAIAHLRYIDRNGKLEIETDEGKHLKGTGVEKDITADWDLESVRALGHGPYRAKPGRKPAKLVHNIILSMPKGTPPERLLVASRAFAREEFALQHRYVLVLHTDQDHPHVHLVVRAVGEDGKRLNIRKATLRHWRGLFAHELRAHGVVANATERAVRGQIRSGLKDGIYRASMRGQSRHLRDRAERVLQEVRDGGLKLDPGKANLLQTRREVVAGWHAAAEALLDAGQGELAQKIWRFVGGMRPPLTTDEQIAAHLVERPRTRIREQDREQERSR